MNKLIFSPQDNATPDEIMQVLKVFTVPSMPNANNELLLGVYETLPPEAKRHFKLLIIKEDNK